VHRFGFEHIGELRLHESRGAAIRDRRQLYRDFGYRDLQRNGLRRHQLSSHPICSLLRLRAVKGERMTKKIDWYYQRKG
jgi:hypothetical protein